MNSLQKQKRWLHWRLPQPPPSANQRETMEGEQGGSYRKRSMLRARLQVSQLLLLLG